MNRLSIFRELRRHRSLASKRALDAERNRSAKVLGIVGMSFIVLYLMALAIMISLAVNGSTEMTPIEFVIGLFPFVMLIDFQARLVAQQTPSQLVKPYVLLPLPRYACVESFILNSVLSSGNLIWMAFFVPFCIMSVVFSYGVWTATVFLLFIWLLIALNSQIYMICRTFINDSYLWWALPIAIYAIIFLPLYWGFDLDFERFLSFYMWPGQFVARGNLLPVVAAVVLLIGVMTINRRVQYTHVMKELSRVETTKISKISSFSFFERYGEVGTFLQLELKLTLRNKNPRKQFLSATLLVAAFSALLAFTDVYDNDFMQGFLGFYNFVIFGAMGLAQLLSVEGNYIDCLMVRKENILKLLTAKYIFYVAVLIFPFVLMLPPVISGKWSIFTIVAYALFTAGFQYFALFQTAAYTKRTVPLNTKFISKSNMETNWVQLIMQLAVMFLPVIVLQFLSITMSQQAVNLVLSLIGLAFIATHRIWLRSVYKRVMARHYDNFEGFRATR